MLSLCVLHTLSSPFSIAVNFIQQFVRLMQKSNCLLKTWVTNASVPQQWRGNTNNSCLYLKKERIALSFKYFMSISQQF